MDDYPTQLVGQLWDADGPLSQDVTEFYDITETLKERLLEARYYAEEERTMKSLDSWLNRILVGAVVTTFVNKFATMQPNFRLYPFHTRLVAGLHDVLHTIENGTFTSGTFLSVFAAPSFTLWALQGVIDACHFVPPLVVVAAIFGKWILGHFSSSEDRHEQTGRRPLHDWPKDARARILSWLDVLHTILALSEILYCMCWVTGQSPLVGLYIVGGIAVFCMPGVYYFYRMKSTPRLNL